MTSPSMAQEPRLNRLSTDGGQRFRECVSCGFREPFDAQRARSDHAEEALKTRVNQPRVGEETLAHGVEVQAIKFVDPGSKRKEH